MAQLEFWFKRNRFDVADIGNIQRDIQSIDQVYALAPSIIAVEYPMSSTRAGIVPTAQTTRTNAKYCRT